MKMNKRLFGFLLALVLTLVLLPGMSLTAYADNTTGTEITEETTNLTAGTYYLSSDVALNSEMTITSGDVIINLNGHTLSLKNGAADWQSVIYVNGGNLTVNGGNGGKISGGTGGHNKRGGGFHIDSGNVIVNNVDITGNKGAWGGGVFIDKGNSGTFTMNNSYIRNNTSIDDGNGWNDAGGVYLDGGVFTINGGSITENHVVGNKKNGLVLADGSAKLNISGDVLIYDNKDGGTQENLHADALFGGSSPINIIGQLGTNAKIGITSQWHQVFTTSENTEYNDPTKFYSDNSNYRVGRNTDGQLMLARYNEIIYQATGYDGNYDNQEHGIKVIASDPDTAIIRYGTSEDNCNLESSPVFKDATETTVYYQISASVGTDDINYEPVKGSAVVKIKKIDPIANAPRATATFGWTLADVSLTNPEGNTPGEWKWVDAGTTSVGNAGSNTFKANFTPTDTVNYNTMNDVDVTVEVSKAGSTTELPDVQKPKAKENLTDTGEPQELVTPPEKLPDGYQKVQYSIDGGKTWTDEEPKGTDAGSYTVKVKYVAKDDNHTDFFGEDILVTIGTAMNIRVDLINLLYNGQRTLPKEIKELSLNPVIHIALDETESVSRNLTFDLEQGMDNPKKYEKVEFTAKVEDLAPGKYEVTVTGLPKVVYGQEDDIYSADDGMIEGRVLWKYALTAKAEINVKKDSGTNKEETVITVYLIWDDGSRPEEIKVYALPEDEIGAYALRADGTKEYLLFHTYDICMNYLGRDELCRGYERCFHKESPYVNPFVQP